jgi:GGDEF domain-containing protein
LAIPFQQNMENQHRALAHLLSLIGSINSLALNNNLLRQIYNAENGNEDNTKMMLTMLAQTKILETM